VAVGRGPPPATAAPAARQGGLGMATVLAVGVLLWAVPCGVRLVYGLVWCRTHNMPYAVRQYGRGW
jgi:hypothetical protein